MQITENLKISLILFFVFLISYTLLIPFYTNKPDVIVFALRSLADSPILDIAYLNSNTYLNGEPLPNYHLGHTVILWIVYNLFPESLANSIWPSGFVSAISGALIVVLTFLIWKELGINTKKSLLIAIAVGIIPSFIEEAIIGEVYALQFLFTLLFIYSFIIDKWILSSFFFLLACLVSPLSGLAFGLLFLKNRNKSTLIRAIGVGAIALILYLSIYIGIGSNLFDLLNPSSQQPAGRGIIYRILILGFFIALNFNFLLIYFVKGLKISFENEKQLLLPLIVASLPQLLLLVAGSTFFIELGSFQLPIFWALAFPLGIYLADIYSNSKLLWVAIVCSFVFSYVFWVNPNNTIGSAREEAGTWLKENNYNNISVVGPWSVGISILKGRDGNSIDSLNNYYLNKPCPNNEDILKINKDKLLIAEAKKTPLRVSFSKLGIPGTKLRLYDPVKEITTGNTVKIFENNHVLIYEWTNQDSLTF